MAELYWAPKEYCRIPIIVSNMRPPRVALEKRMEMVNPYIRESAIFSSIVTVGASKV